MRGRVGRRLQLKSTGALWAGWKGASASEDVAEYSMVGRVKAGRLRGADAAEVGYAKGLKGARPQARQMFGPISFSVAGVLSADVFCLVSCLTQRALVASYCIPPPAATGGHILWTRILPSCSYTSGSCLSRCSSGPITSWMCGGIPDQKSGTTKAPGKVQQVMASSSIILTAR